MNLINEDDKSFGVSFDCDEVRCFKKLFDDEKFYGLGEKTGPLIERATICNVEFRYTPLYK